MMNVYGYTTERQSYYGNEISYIPKNSRSVLMTKISSIFFYLLLSSSNQRHYPDGEVDTS